VLGAEDLDTLTAMSNLATILCDQGQLKEAKQLFLQVVEASRRVLGAEYPGTLISMSNLTHNY
jgi:Tetratricopeptide repeat